jgi:hypothetical protein
MMFLLYFFMAHSKRRTPAPMAAYGKIVWIEVTAAVVPEGWEVLGVVPEGWEVLGVVVPAG